VGNLWPWFLALAIVGVANAAISAGYYLKIIGVMYFRPSLEKPEANGGGGPALAMALCVLMVLGIGCFPGPLVEAAKRASRSARTLPRAEVQAIAVDADASAPDASLAER
jgi:NADH-quinone oxidoreductase subunit N